MRKTTKQLCGILLAAVMTIQGLYLNSNIVEAVPAVTETEVETACIYDAGYQNGEWFAFIDGGTWKEELGETAKVIFYNAKTDESKVWNVYENDEKVFDYIEPVFFEENWKTYATEYYRVVKDEKQALLCADGAPYGGSLVWYDSIDMSGECVIATSGDTKKVLKEEDNKVTTVFEQLSSMTSFTYKDGYYFLNNNGQSTVYDKDMQVVTIELPEGFQLCDTEQYGNYIDYGYAAVYKKTLLEKDEAGFEKNLYEYNVVNSEGQFLFEKSVESQYYNYEPFGISEEYIWNDLEYCLYKIDGMQVVLNKEMIVQDFKEKANVVGEWDIDYGSYSSEYIGIAFATVEELAETGKSHDNKWITYSQVDGYRTACEGELWGYLTFTDGGGEWDEEICAYLNDYYLNREKNTLYNYKTGETIQLLADENYIWAHMYPALGSVLISRYNIEIDSVDETWGFPYYRQLNTEYYLLQEDGTLKKCDDFLYFRGIQSDDKYNVFALQLDGKWHWYMNDFDNEIMQTDVELDNMNLSLKDGYFQGIDDEGKAFLYDQYGNIILGDDTHYTIIGNGDVWRSVFEISGTINGAAAMQDGYILVADANGKYGVLDITVKYTLTGEVEVTVESEDASFVSERMEVTETKEQADLKEITAKIKSEIGQSTGIDIKVYDISFYGIDGKEKQPEGKVKVTMSIPSGWDASKEIKVYHVLDDLAVEDMNAKIEDGKIVFYTDGFSQYALTILDNTTIEGTVKGDANGDKQVTLADAQATLKAALKIIKTEEIDAVAADVDGKEGITLSDAQMILKAALKIIKL